jgi:hypothetical protein
LLEILSEEAWAIYLEFFNNTSDSNIIESFFVYNAFIEDRLKAELIESKAQFARLSDNIQYGSDLVRLNWFSDIDQVLVPGCCN